MVSHRNNDIFTHIYNYNIYIYEYIRLLYKRTYVNFFNFNKLCLMIISFMLRILNNIKYTYLYHVIEIVIFNRYN